MDEPPPLPAAAAAAAAAAATTTTPTLLLLLPPVTRSGDDRGTEVMSPLLVAEFPPRTLSLVICAGGEGAAAVGGECWTSACGRARAKLQPKRASFASSITDVVVQEGDATGRNRGNQQLWHAIWRRRFWTPRIDDLPSDYSATKSATGKTRKIPKLFLNTPLIIEKSTLRLSPPPRRIVVGSPEQEEDGARPQVTVTSERRRLTNSPRAFPPLAGARAGT